MPARRRAALAATLALTALAIGRWAASPTPPDAARDRALARAVGDARRPASQADDEGARPPATAALAPAHDDPDQGGQRPRAPAGRAADRRPAPARFGPGPDAGRRADPDATGRPHPGPRRLRC